MCNQKIHKNHFNFYSLIAKGVPSSTGIASGQIVFNKSQIMRSFRCKNKTILIQTEPNRLSIEHISNLAGIAIGGGGMTSHVAILARSRGIPCIMGLKNLKMISSDRCLINNIILKKFDKITLDGTTGALYKGKIDIHPKVYLKQERKIKNSDLNFLTNELEKRKIEYSFLYDDRLFFPKSLGLTILKIYKLPTPKVFDINNLTSLNTKFFSIRSSFLLGSVKKDVLKIGFNLPTKFNVLRKKLASSINEVRDKFIKLYNETPDLLIHKTHKIKCAGNLEVNKTNKTIAIEVWKSYKKNDCPNLKKINYKHNQKILVNNILFPRNIYRLPFQNYLIEWILTENNKLLFMEINILSK